MKGKHMGKFVGVLTGLCFMFLCSCAFGSEVPGVTPLDFARDASSEASFIWQLLAGQGVWGAILFAFVGFAWPRVKPYLDEWMRQRKLARLWDALTAGVTGTLQTYVEAVKAAGDGKLTEEQAAHARDLARTYAVTFMKTQGEDIMQEYGQAVLDFLIEAILSRLKIDNAALKAVATPLSDSAPLPPSVSLGVMPA